MNALFKIIRDLLTRRCGDDLRENPTDQRRADEDREQRESRQARKAYLKSRKTKGSEDE